MIHRFRERRKDKRADARFYTMLVLGSPKPFKQKVNACDISKRGIRITIHTATFPGDRTLTSFTLPGYSDIIITPAMVVWSQKHATCYEVGIEFKCLTEEDKTAIHTYVEQHANKVA